MGRNSALSPAVCDGLRPGELGHHRNAPRSAGAPAREPAPMHDSPYLDLEHFLSRAQVRRLLGVGQTTLERMVKRGDFPPPVRLGARLGP